ncbi:hypothetical protein [Lentzea jiangxiensis]|nr:hypothetical protein [Lentzea jiangxiensis]
MTVSPFSTPSTTVSASTTYVLVPVSRQEATTVGGRTLYDLSTAG